MRINIILISTPIFLSCSQTKSLGSHILATGNLTIMYHLESYSSACNLYFSTNQLIKTRNNCPHRYSSFEHRLITQHPELDRMRSSHQFLSTFQLAHLPSTSVVKLLPWTLGSDRPPAASAYNQAFFLDKNDDPWLRDLSLWAIVMRMRKWNVWASYVNWFIADTGKCLNSLPVLCGINYRCTFKGKQRKSVTYRLTIKYMTPSPSLHCTNNNLIDVQLQ
jgi:hypothetical protein